MDAAPCGRFELAFKLSCSLLIFRSLVPTNFFVFCLAVLVQLDIC